MKMDEHARAWAHEFVAGILNTTSLPPEQRNSLHWEILSHLYEAAERRAEERRGTHVTLADLHVVVTELGGRDGIASAFLQTRVAATPRAGFVKRSGAFIIDAVVAGLALGFLLGGVAGMFGGLLGAFFVPVFGLEPFFFLGAFYAYLVFTEYRYGATIGKMAFKLRTVRTDGRPLNVEAALVRNVAKAVPPLLVLDALLYLVAFRNEDQRASDRLAETVVIDTTKAVWSPPIVPSLPPGTLPAPSPSPAPAPAQAAPASLKDRLE